MASERSADRLAERRCERDIERIRGSASLCVRTRVGDTYNARIRTGSDVLLKLSVRAIDRGTLSDA